MLPDLSQKNIIVGITGSIAAYKSLELIRRLNEIKVSVTPVLTSSARQFITPLSLQALTKQRVRDALFDKEAEMAMGHIELARQAELIVIAPASANFIARLNLGLADDLLSTLCLATTAPILLAPAMNQHMWQNPTTQHHIKQLCEKNIKILEPAIGSQACGEWGPGRMLEAHEIFEEIINVFQTKTLSGKHILITAGATQEAIDPVRYLSNKSSGKMGFALAKAAERLGATVTLIAGPTEINPSPHIKLISVVSAQDMLNAVHHHLEKQDIIIGAAAVSDYRVAEPCSKKMDKETSSLSLTLVKNPDILASITALPKHPFTIGFAAQTHHLIENARKKLLNKKLDMIIANDVSDPTIGFNSGENEVIVLWDNQQQLFPKQSKQMLAHQLMQFITQRYYEKYPDKNTR